MKSVTVTLPPVFRYADVTVILCLPRCIRCAWLHIGQFFARFVGLPGRLPSGLGLESVGIRILELGLEFGLGLGLRLRLVSLNSQCLISCWTDYFTTLLLVFWASAWVIRSHPIVAAIVIAGAIAVFPHSLASKAPIWTKSGGKVSMILMLPLSPIRLLLLCC